MAIIQKIIEFVLGLLGIKKPAALGGGMSADERARAGDQIRGLENVTGAENIKVHGMGANANTVIRQDGASLIEDDGEEQWVSTVNHNISPDQWADIWGPLAGPDEESLVTFFAHEKVFDMERSGEPRSAADKLTGFGYDDVGHFYKVRTTVIKHHATAHGPTLQEYVFDSQEVMNAMMKAAQQMHRLNMQATADANPEILEPIEGVSVQLYAQVSAKSAQGMTNEQLDAELAQHGVDRATWDRASAGWLQRMQNDTTATITTIYGEAFQNAGQGQFGAHAQAHAATGYDGSAAAGSEPIPFELCCEIQGATGAWSKTGQDVNALLQQKFNMNAADWSAANSWWMTQMMANLPKFEEYNSKIEMYEKQYMGAAAAPTDQDITF